jgi:NAD(P)-dependent dehydrogenase (short-subunit alcohol dehydrogenase family)
MGLLDGKVAVITGAGGGIGRHYALQFAREGASIVVNDLGGPRDGGGAGSHLADEVVEEVKAIGGKAVASYDSVAKEAGAENIIQTALSAFGKLHILVNNAGIIRDKTLLKMDIADFDSVIAVHLRGSWLMSRAAGRVLREQSKGGRIINTSSHSGLIGNFGQSNYGAAKAGIAGLTRISALEYARDKINVNAIAPVAFTRMTDDLPRFQGENIEGKLSPEHVAPLAVYLASDLSQSITGKIFGVEGSKFFEYKMMMTEGVEKESLWTPQEVSAEIDRIMKL